MKMYAQKKHNVLLLTCVMTSLLAYVSAFNIDLRYIVGYHPGLLMKDISFGYSVAIVHNSTAFTNTANETEYRMLIGAPRLRGLEGGIFICGIARPGQKGDYRKCREFEYDFIIIDKDETERSKKAPPMDGMVGRMGAFVATSRREKEFMACAPGYSDNGFFGQQDHVYKPLGSCLVHRGPRKNYRLTPCYKDREQTAYASRGHCGSGISGIITSSTSSSGNEAASVILGSPVATAFRGTYSATKFSRDPRSDEKNDTISESRFPIDVDGLRPDAYQGYAMTELEFDPDSSDSDDVVQFAVSAPGGTRGEVYLKKADAIIDYQHEPQQTFVSSKNFEFFGYSLAAGDFNGDGYKDLIVGCPFYADTKMIVPDRGRVLIFLHLGLKAGARSYYPSEPNIILHGDPTHRQFGIALATADLDNDGYSDVIVGAPFAGDGFVYIFRGSSASVPPSISQILSGKDRGVTSFGFSLFAEEDVDNNDHPDLAVGCFNSDRVFMFWSRTVVPLVAQIELPTKDVVQIKDSKSFGALPVCENLRIASAKYPQRCFSSLRNEEMIYSMPVKIKFSWLNRTPSKVKRHGYNIDWSLVLDEKQQVKRFFFKYGKVGAKMMDRVSKDEAKSKTENWSVNGLLFVKAHMENEDSPINIAFNYNLSDSQPGFEAKDLQPIITDDAKPQNILLELRKGCGDDAVCVPDLQARLRSSQAALVLGSKQLTLKITVKNKGEPAYYSMAYLKIPKYVKHVDTQDVSQTEGSNFTLSCGPKTVNEENYIICLLDNPFPSNTTIKFKLILDPQYVSHEEPEIAFNLYVNSSSKEDERTLHDNNKTITIPLELKAKYRLSGFSTPEVVRYNKTWSSWQNSDADKFGPEVVHVYSIYNSGESSLPASTVLINWPVRVTVRDTEQMHLMYLPKLPKIDGSATCKVDPNDLDPIGKEIEVPQSDNQNYKAPKQQKDGTTVFDCNTVSCTTINCSLGVLKSKEQVKIYVYSKLFTNTLSKLDVEDLNISSNAKFELGEVSYKILEDNSSVDATVVWTFAERDAFEELAPELHWWIILIAVVAGLLILVLLIAICYRVGFFRRVRVPPPTHRAQRTSAADNAAGESGHIRTKYMDAGPDESEAFL